MAVQRAKGMYLQAKAIPNLRRGSAFEMGKARRKKAHGSTARTAVDSSTAVSAQESQPPPHLGEKSSLKSDMKSGVLEGLTSLNSATRESSCAAIASLFEKIDAPEAESDSWSAAQRLIAGGLIKKLLPRMLDRAPDVKLHATGAMRNISAVRDARICEIMVQDDCLTPVLTLLDRMSTTPTAVVSAAGNGASAINRFDGSSPAGANVCAFDKMTPHQETTIMAQLVATLCNIMAAVDVAVTRFTKQGGLQVVMRLLQEQGCKGSAEIFGGALQALHISTDSNAELAVQLVAFPRAVDQFSALVGGQDVTHVKVSTSMRVQAAGVLVNVIGLAGNAVRSAGAQAELSRVVLPLLLEQMAYDPSALRDACVALASPSAKPARGEGEMDVDGEGGSSNSSGDANKQEKTAEIENTVAEARVAAAVAAATPLEVATRGAINIEEVTRPGGAFGTEAPPGRGADEEGGHGDEVPDQRDLDAEVRWEWKLGVAEPLKLTAEVLTNLCALGAAEGDEEEEQEWGSDDEDAMEQQAASVYRDGATQQYEAKSDAGRSAPTVLLDAMTEGGALQRVFGTLKALLSPTPRDLQPETAGGRKSTADLEMESMPSPPPKTNGSGPLPLPLGTAGDLADLRATVALCAANLVQNLPSRALGANPNALWVELCGMSEAAVERAPSCMETLTGVMWGLVRRSGPAIVAGFGPATPVRASEGTTASMVAYPHPLLLRLCDPEKTRAFEARVNAVGMLGTLGAAVSELRGSAGDLEIGRALVRAMEDPHVLVQAEAINAVMDLYGEDDRDAAFRASGAPKALAGWVPAFKRKVKQEGKALGRDAFCHLKETALNATRFVKYKAIHGGGVSAGVL